MVKKLEEEFEKLIELFEKGNMQELDLQEALKTATGLFTKLQEYMMKAPPEEQQELVEKMNSMYRRLAAATQKMALNSGMSEEELMKAAENRDNFTDEQWESIQESKKMVTEMSEELTKQLNSPEFKEAAKKLTKETPPPKPLTERKPKWIKP